jgi:pimeloyl-ACP methyl ester carboxylesterase
VASREGADAWRWKIQHEHMKTDPVSGVDKRVLSRVEPHPASSHTAYASDGTAIHYKRFGSPDAKRTLFLLNGLGGTYRTWCDVFVPLLGDFQVVVPDYRGLFESGRPPSLDSLRVVDHAKDALLVMDHAGVKEVVLAGWSMGVQVCLEVWRLASERVSALILVSGVDGRVMSSALGFPLSDRVIPAAVRLLRDYGGAVTATMARAVQTRAVVEMAQRLGLVGRNASSTMEHAALLFSTEPEIYWRIAENLQEHEATDMLATIDVPTLILHGDADVLTPVSRGRYFRTHIRDSEMWVFHGCTHAVILEYPERVSGRMRDFVERRLKMAQGPT